MIKLDFDKMRHITNKMKVESLEYANFFWQYIFNSIEPDKNWCIFDEYEFSVENFPKDSDPQSFFENIHFIIECTWFGQIRVIFDSNSYINNYNSECYLLETSLLNNGFIRVVNEEKGIMFVRNL